MHGNLSPTDLVKLESQVIYERAMAEDEVSH